MNEDMRGTAFISAAFLATSLLLIVEGLLGKEPLAPALTIALYACSASIPILAFSVLYPAITSYRTVWGFFLLEMAGWLMAITGLIAVIWHLSPLAAYVFLGSGIIVVLSRVIHSLLT